ncbi:MAG: hypothetical protein OEZ40_07260 [Candidatus Bathyarchaeota archaeon]|nr:hypothetical protein [Candidatus Bathyarchaeota archaeon]
MGVQNHIENWKIGLESCSQAPREAFSVIRQFFRRVATQEIARLELNSAGEFDP